MGPTLEVGWSQIQAHVLRYLGSATPSIVIRTAISRLPTRDCQCRPDRQFQRLAQCDQIFVAWPCPTLLPQIHAIGGDAGKVSNIGDR
jgi:hypothetical protein